MTSTGRWCLFRLVRGWKGGEKGGVKVTTPLNGHPGGLDCINKTDGYEYSKHDDNEANERWESDVGGILFMKIPAGRLHCAYAEIKLVDGTSLAQFLLLVLWSDWYHSNCEPRGNRFKTIDRCENPDKNKTDRNISSKQKLAEAALSCQRVAQSLYLQGSAKHLAAWSQLISKEPIARGRRSDRP